MPAGTRPKKQRRLAVKLGLSLVVTLVLLLVLELCSGLFLRRVATYSEILHRFGPPYPVARSDYLPFTTPSSVVLDSAADDHAGGRFGRLEFNRFGYRGPDPAALEKPAGVKRLLVLGDSFVLGWGIDDEEDTIPGQLRARLAAEGQRWEVVNGGYRGGHAPDAYHAFLRREGIALQPDAVVIVLFTGNDLNDVANHRWLETDERGGPTRLDTIRFYTDFTGGILDPRCLPARYHWPILRESRLFLALCRAWEKLVAGAGSLPLVTLGDPLPESEARERFEQCTEATVAMLRERSIPVVYVSFSFLGTPRAEDPHDPMVTALLRRLSVPHEAVHDLLDERHAIPADLHTNADGNRVIVDRILHLLPR